MSRTGFLDKTLSAVADVLERAFFSEAFAYQRGFLQALDIRVKLITFLLIIILISFLRAPQTMWLLFGISLALAAASHIPLRFFLKRVLLFVPLFSAIIVLPALLNIITPGEPVLTIARLGHARTWGLYTIPQEIAVTRQGLWGGIVFVSRVSASVSFAALFLMSAKWGEVFAGLRALFMPRIFVVTLSMTYRYLFVVLRLIQDMYRARKSRTIRPFSAAVERNWTASRIGVTFKRSMEMSADIYQAMLARGFHGEFPSINRLHAAPADYVWLMTVLLFGGILIVFERKFFLP
ncbi:MAG TPA: cobalt ECF transporter T component CbiQ [Nitrospirota bacterium]